MPLHHVPHDAMVPHHGCPAASNFDTKFVRLFRVSGRAAEPGFLFFVAAAGVRTKGTEEGSAHTSGNEARSGADAEKTVSSACMLGMIIEMDTLGFEPRAFRMRSGCDATTPCAPGRHFAESLYRAEMH